MKRSISDVYRKIEIEREIRINQERAHEQRMYELREVARQEYLKRMRMNEFLSVPSSSSSSSAGSGGGRLRISSPSFVLGESILILFEEDSYWNYFIYNYTEDDINEGRLDILTNEWSYSSNMSASNKGFLLSFYSSQNSSTINIFIISVSGEILFNTSSTTDDYNYSNRSSICYFRYRKDNIYYYILYDGNIRTLELDANYNISIFRVLTSGGFIYSLDDQQYFYIRNDSSESMFIGDNFSIVEGHNNSPVFITIDSSSLLRIYDINGNVLLSYALSDLSLNYVSMNTIGINGSFIMTFSDPSNISYIFYYNIRNNSFTYRTVDTNTYIYNYLGNSIDSKYSYTYDKNGAQFLYFGSTFTLINQLWYTGEMLILPIFESQDSMPDFYTFSTSADGNTKGIYIDYARISKDIISVFCDGGSGMYGVINFKSDGTTTFSETELLVADNRIDNFIDLRNREFIALRDVNTNITIPYFISKDGSLVTTSVTFSHSSNEIYYRGDVLIIHTSDKENSFYTNTSLGNNFFEINTGTHSYTTENVNELSSSLDFSNIVLYSEDANQAIIFSDDDCSGSFTYSTISADFKKTSIKITTDYLVYSETVEVTTAKIPYTHTQLSEGGPVPLGTSPSVYLMDGIVTSSDQYFGTGSSYFTNFYPGLFVLSADNINMYEFGIFGGVGADGSGDSNIFEYTTVFNSKTYYVYVKTIGNTNDPSVNHIMITDAPAIHTATSNTDFDNDTLIEMYNCTKISYLLLSQPDGLQLTDEQIHNISDYYIQNIFDGNNIDDVLLSINTNYLNITSFYDPYYFSDQGDPGEISDGGNDMYDGGNKISTFLEPPPIGYGGRFVVFDLLGNIVNEILKPVGETSPFFYNDFHNIIELYDGNYFQILRSDGSIYDIGLTNVVNTMFNDWIWWDD